MGSKKTVTEMTLVANRLNAKRSTGPRTARGKNSLKVQCLASRAVCETRGYTLCDGDGSEGNSSGCWLTCSGSSSRRVRLRSSTSRRWRRACGDFVERPARRRDRLEFSTSTGKPRDVYYSEAKPIMDSHHHCAKRNAGVQDDRDLSSAAYAAVLPVLEIRQACAPQREDGNSPTEPKIDDHFWLLLERHEGLLEARSTGDSA